MLNPALGVSFVAAIAVLVLPSAVHSQEAKSSSPPASAAGELPKKTKNRQDRDGFRELIRDIQEKAAAFASANAAGATVATFRYRPDEVFRINIRPGMFTTFTIPKNEPILQFAVSNPKAVDLSVNQDANTAMVRLLNDESVSATLVTSKRAYFMMLMPASLDMPWHIGAGWSYDEHQSGKDSMASGFGFSARAEASGSTTSSAAATGAIEPGYDPQEPLRGHPNFGYVYERGHPLAPAAVWDNGRYTWIQLRPEQQGVPAVFYIGPNGLEVINYTVLPGSKQILVTRLMPKFILRLGSESLEIAAKQ